MDIEAFRSHFADSPTAAAYVDAVFGPADASLRAEFAETVDESVFPPRQWVSALRVMGEWLDARGLDLALRDRIGYLSCAAESGAPAGRLEDLPSLVTEMLAQYGCERAVPAEDSRKPEG